MARMNTNQKRSSTKVTKGTKACGWARGVAPVCFVFFVTFVDQLFSQFVTIRAIRGRL